jgi:hypothetical protein
VGTFAGWYHMLCCGVTIKSDFCSRVRVDLVLVKVKTSLVICGTGILRNLGRDVSFLSTLIILMLLKLGIEKAPSPIKL